MSVTFGQEQRIPARRRGTLLKDCPPVCKAAGIGPREIPSSEQMNRLMEQSSYLCRNCSVSSVYPSGFLLSCSASGRPVSLSSSVQAPAFIFAFPLTARNQRSFLSHWDKWKPWCDTTAFSSHTQGVEFIKHKLLIRFLLLWKENANF